MHRGDVLGYLRQLVREGMRSAARVRLSACVTRVCKGCRRLNDRRGSWKHCFFTKAMQRYRRGFEDWLEVPRQGTVDAHKSAHEVCAWRVSGNCRPTLR